MNGVLQYGQIAASSVGLSVKAAPHFVHWAGTRVIEFLLFLTLQGKGTTKITVKIVIIIICNCDRLVEFCFDCHAIRFTVNAFFCNLSNIDFFSFRLDYFFREQVMILGGVGNHGLRGGGLDRIKPGAKADSPGCRNTNCRSR